jgi:hypothetical protein
VDRGFVRVLVDHYRYRQQGTEMIHVSC